MCRQSNVLRGFTLAEVVVAAGILIFALCSLVSSLIGFMVLAEIARDKTVAINDAQQIMEQIRDTAFSSIIGTNWASWAITNGCNTLNSEQAAVTFSYPGSPSTDLLQITVTVNWRTRDRPMSISMVSCRNSG